MEIKITTNRELKPFVRTSKSVEIVGLGRLAKSKLVAEENAKRALRKEASKKGARGIVLYQPAYEETPLKGGNEVWYRCRATGIPVFLVPKKGS